MLPDSKPSEKTTGVDPGVPVAVAVGVGVLVPAVGVGVAVPGFVQVAVVELTVKVRAEPDGYVPEKVKEIRAALPEPVAVKRPTTVEPALTS
jgi:hypothetical protein